MRLNVYHLTLADDLAAIRLVDEVWHQVEEKGGFVHSSRSHGVGPAYVVLALPEGVKPADFGLSEARAVGFIDPTKPESVVNATDAFDDDDDDEGVFADKDYGEDA